MNIRRAAPSGLLAVIAATGLLLSGCAGIDEGPGPGGGGKARVVASFYPLKFIVREVGGPHVKVTGLTKPGAEPHDLEMTPRQVARLVSADLVVYLKGLQPDLDKAVKQNKPKRVVEAGALEPREEHDDGGHEAGEDGHDHAGGEHAEDEHAGEAHTEDGHAGGEHAEDEHADEAHTEDGHDHAGHDHGNGRDPHVWLDPTRMAAIASGVGESLAEADPAHAPDYRARAADLAERLHSLDEEFTAGLRTCARTDFVTSHAAFGYLAERYHLNEIPVSGLSPESEPSPARRARIQELIRDKGITTVYFETLAEPKTARALAADLKLRAAVLDPLEGVADEDEQDYFSVMRANLDALRKGLGCS